MSGWILRFVLMVVVGCSSVSEATTPSAVQPATTTTATSAPASEPAVAKTVDPAVCPPGGGGQTSRGFYCPPDIPRFEGDSDVVFQLMPGTYRTRFFETDLEFTRNDRFGVSGEAHVAVEMDRNLQGGLILALNDAVAAAFRETDLASHECAQQVVAGESTVGGLPAQSLTASFTCDIFISSVQGDPLGFGLFEGTTTLLLYVEISDRTVLVEVLAPTGSFGDYLTSQAHPLIDSIRFLDN